MARDSIEICSVEVIFQRVVWWLLALCGGTSLLLAVLGDRPGRWSFALAGSPLAITFVGTIFGSESSQGERAELAWVRELDLVLAFRLDAFSSLLLAIVSGIGVLVCVYAAGYFTSGTIGVGRFAATLLAFATAMLGLVAANTAFTLFVFWELTSITSFLLVGHKRLDATARTAARRALVITAAGGLVLLAGMVLLLDVSNASRLSELSPVSGGTATAAAVLIMIAAATKSAQVPFHMWLPGAMAAPTPVSAYLHSATMVKAGVVLVAIASPALSGITAWKVIGVAVGSASMLWGGIGALRQNDAKLILAWGTISQLGLMIVLLSLGNAKATFAGLAVLAAHAIFKAALFMVVGEIDVRTGTRDVRELNGLWRSMPVAFGVAVVSGASMAGIPPLLGFPAKEAAIEAGLGLAGSERAIVLTLIVIGAVLTVAYTTRFVVTTFGGRDPATDVSPPRTLLAAPSVVLSASSIVGFVLLGSVSSSVRDAAVLIDEDSSVYSLLRWPGLTDAFLVSMAVVVAGALFGLLVVVRSSGRVPEPVGAQSVDDMIDGAITGSRHVAAVVQHGSLPGYVLMILGVAAIASSPFWFAIERSSIVGWDNRGQAVIAALVIASAVAATVVGSRLGAALVLGAVGLLVSGLFVAQGALDLVLTQLLVETVIIVGFVVGLGSLADRFPPNGAIWLVGRIGVAALAAGAVGAALLASGSSTSRTPATDALVPLAVSEGGGKNVVNVVLTDVRALDTYGEVIVLVVVAIGLLSLLRTRTTDEGVS